VNAEFVGKSLVLIAALVALGGTLHKTGAR
jgi:hypothetical protein